MQLVVERDSARTHAGGAAPLIIAAAAFALVLAALTGLARPLEVVGPQPSTKPAANDPLLAGAFASLPSPGDGAAAVSPVSRAQVFAFYGNPNSREMGILGAHPPDVLAALLAEAAARIDKQNGAAAMLPALHIVYAVAQGEPQADGTYLQRLDDKTLATYLALARRNGFLVVLDLQVGHADPLDEARRLYRVLREPDVHLALDPEFALTGDVRPGEAVGSLEATAINAVQAYLASVAAEAAIPRKMLIVHQFQSGMLPGAEGIERRDDVDLVVDMDGVGPAEIKRVKYGWYGGATYAMRGGIKIFLQHDPDPIPEAEILALQPRPAFIVYQ